MPQREFKRIRQALASLPAIPNQLRFWVILIRAHLKGIICDPFDIGKSRPIAFKHMGNYLSQSLSVSERLVVLICNYSFLTNFGKQYQKFSIREGTLIWDYFADSHKLAIHIGPSILAPMEGEIALTFSLDDRILSTVTLVVAPGTLVGVSRPYSIVIGGVQGALRSREDIRLASKAMHEISPSDALITSVRALAEIFDIETICGLPLESHTTFGHSHIVWGFDYNALWERLGATRTREDFFSFSARPETRLEAEIFGSHRARTRRKRLARVALQEEVRGCFQERWCMSFCQKESVGLPRPSRDVA